MMAENHYQYYDKNVFLSINHQCLLMFSSTCIYSHDFRLRRLYNCRLNFPPYCTYDRLRR